MREKRRSIRVKVNATVSFIVKSTGLAGDSRIIDISEGGMCIQSKQYLNVNAILEMEIHADDLKEPIKTLARVVRITNRDTGKFKFELGLEFIDLPFAKWSILRSYIQRSMLQGNQEVSGID